MAEIKRVGILGSGIMGAGLAEVAARAGYEVVVRSRSLAAANEMMATIDKGFRKAIERGKSTEEVRAAVLGRITATDQLTDVADCDLVIESVIEDLNIKLGLFAELDSVVKAGAILATNTSTLPVIELARATQRPESVCGIHFFNPATVMTVVEVVRPITASEETIATAMEFATRCGKDVVETKDHAGFIVNALLFPYLNNAVHMLERGTAPMESIDVAMKGGCNFPMGPFALLDLVGLDTSVAILDALHAQFGDAHYAAAPTLRKMVADGQLGRKSKRGFYTY
ncbi:MAG: NAD(P)-binding domain-containing protein [Actinomycetia bacterium]|nr:NAD(P)-binding domain-containing protein [Actinomycetes bacterium]